MPQPRLELRTLVANIVGTLIRQLLTLLSGLTLSVLVARILGPEKNGMYAVAVLFTTLLVTLLNLGLGAANVYFVARGDVSLRAARRVTMQVWALLSGVGLLLGTGVLLFYRDLVLPNVPTAVGWLALAIFPLYLLQTFIMALLHARQDFRSYNLALLTASIAGLLAAAIALIFFKGEVIGALIALAVGFSLSVIIAWNAVSRHIDATQPALPPAGYIGQALRYSILSYISNLITFFTYRIDVYLIGFFLGATAVGIYAVAVQLAERIWTLSQAVSAVLLPRLAALHADEATRLRLTPLMSRWVLLLTLLLSFAVALALWFMLVPLFGLAYATALPAFFWIIPGIVTLSFARVLTNDIAARGRPEINGAISFMGLIANVLINLVAIPAMGISGAALASSLSYTLIAVLALIAYVRISGQRPLLTLFAPHEDWVLIRNLIQRESGKRKAESGKH